jgi:hypothetical protein
LIVFSMIWAGQYVVSGHLGWCVNKWSGFPYGEQQVAGGFLALAVIALWLDRRFLWQVARRAVGLRAALPDDREEGLGYRVAALGLIGGLGLLWWLFQRADVPTWVAFAIFANYFIMCLVICRVRAQLGPPNHQLYGAMPNHVLPIVPGHTSLGPRASAMLYLLRPVLQEQRNHPAPLQIEGLKMAEGGRMERRRLAVAMAVVPVIAVLCYFLATIHIGYRTGMASADTNPFHVLVPRWATDELDAVLKNPSGPNWSGTLAMGLSVAVTSCLYFLKLRFVWWPLHPVAYPIASSNTIAYITPALFLGWLIKSLLLRYGGLRAHRTALPFFLGLIAGDALRALLVSVLFEVLGWAGAPPG